MGGVNVRRAGGVLEIVLDRPEVINAADAELRRGLLAALDEARRETAVRAVVVTGSGRGFCVGQDLAESASAPSAGTLLRDGYHPIVLALRELEKPVVAAINGAAAGAGLSLALACDVRLAGESALLIPAFLAIGLVPDAGATYNLVRLLGEAAAFAWLVSGETLDAHAARERGLVSEVVPDDELRPRALALAERLAAGPTVAVGLTKRLLRAALATTLEEQLEREADAQDLAAATADFVEGVAAFRERRPPRFSGT